MLINIDTTCFITRSGLMRKGRWTKDADLTDAEVVVGDLLNIDSMHRVIAGCETICFGMSVSDAYLAATVNAAAVAKHHGVKAFIKMCQMTLSQMSISETTASPRVANFYVAFGTFVGIPSRRPTHLVNL